MLKVFVYLFALLPTFALSNSVSVFINHDDGGSTSTRHLKTFLKNLNEQGCNANVNKQENSTAQLIFDPTPHSIASEHYQDYQLIAIAKTLNNEQVIRSAIVVQASTGITDLATLQGNWIAFISNNSWPGYHLPLALLNKANINEENSHFYYVGNYIGAAAALGHNDVQAAIIVEPLAKRWADVNNLKIIALTQAVETGGWWMHKSLSAQITKQCTNALMQLKKSQHKVLPAWINGFFPVNNAK